MHHHHNIILNSIPVPGDIDQIAIGSIKGSIFQFNGLINKIRITNV